MPATLASELLISGGSRVSDDFESGFMDRTIEAQIEKCREYRLTPLFLELLSGNQPVLEAGCGSGQWMHFFKRNGIESVGIDWSPALQQRSLEFDPTVRFDTGDMRNLPYADSSFGSLIALGSPEHVIDGPRQIFREFFRVLRPGGIGIVTVPHFSAFRAGILRPFAEPVRRLKRSTMLRRLLGKPPLKAGNTEPRSAVLARRFRPDIYLQVDFDGYFYQYQFTKRQIQEELKMAGFEIEQCFGFNAAGGLLLTLGGVAGRLDRRTQEAKLNWLGRALLKIFSEDQVGHMICNVIRKPL